MNNGFILIYIVLLFVFDFTYLASITLFAWLLSLGIKLFIKLLKDKDVI